MFVWLCHIHGKDHFALFYLQNSITMATSIASGGRSTAPQAMGISYERASMTYLVFHEKFNWYSKNLLTTEILKEKRNNGMWSLAIISSNTFHITMRKNELFLMPLNSCWFIYSHQQWVDVRLFKLAKPFFKAAILV